MSNRVLTASKRRRALPGLVLAATAAAFVLASGAAADDPPIVTVGGAGVAPASGSVGSDPQADACISDQHSGADPAEPNVVGLNDNTCASGSGSSTPGGGSSPGGSSPGGGGGTTRPTGGAQTTSTAGSRGTAGWVSASQAVGLRIVGVRRLTSGVRVTGRFGLVVTLRDTRGRLVRGGIVTIGRVPGSLSTIKNTYSNFTNKAGQARLVVPVTKSMFGKRLFIKISARTPKARAMALRSVVLPRLR